MGFNRTKKPKVTEEPSHAGGRFFEKINILLTYGWPRKSKWLQFRVIFCFFLMVAGRLVNVTVPLYSKWIINDLSYAVEKNAGFNYNLIYIAVLLKFLQGSDTMGGLLGILREYLWIPMQQYTYRELEVGLFAHLHSLPMKWHVNRHIGTVLKVANRGSRSVNDVLNHVFFNVLSTIVDFIVAVTVFTTALNIYFGLLVMITMIAHIGLNVGMTDWRTRFRKEMNNHDNSIGAISTDSLLNYETVKYYGNEKFEVERYQKAIELYQVEEWKNYAAHALQTILQHAILALGIFSGSYYAAFLITDRHQLTVGDYALFATYITQLYNPLNIFAKHYRLIQEAFIDMENMLTLFDEKPEVEDAPDLVDYTNKGGEISIKKLHFSYNVKEPVLNEVSFKATEGQTIALVGVSGSGKSTIIRLLYRLYDYFQGDVMVDGVNIKKFKPSSWRKACGIVPQDTFLFNETIRFNIRYGNLDATDAELEAAAKAAMIHDKIISLPQGYETIVGDRGMKLSGGEKQRLAIARTILKQPNFIFLDEATSALDSHTERAIQRCLEKLCQGRTSIIVAHRLSTVIGADCIMVMERGKIVERGTHADLLTRKGVYFNMWQTQYHQEKKEKEKTEEKAVDAESDYIFGMKKR